MKKHKHDWKFVKIYYKSFDIIPGTDTRSATFICHCGLMKEVQVRVKK